MTAALLGLWLVNLLLDTGGQLAFKAAASRPAAPGVQAHWRAMAGQPWIWLGVGCYVVEFVTWLAFVMQMPLSLAVLLSTLNIVSVALAGWWLFGERPTSLRITGMGLVALGVALVGAGAG